MDVMTDFMMRLKANFAGQVNRPTEVMGFARDLFNVATERGLFPRAKEVIFNNDKRKFILKFFDMPSLLTMAQELPAKFWTDVKIHQFPNIKKVINIVFSMFGLTYKFESSFSHL